MTARDLTALPKGHLHLHLEGAMRPETLAELASVQGIDVPPVRGFSGFSAFIDMYRAACVVLRGETELRRLVREVVEDAADDGVAWIEPTFHSRRFTEQFGSDEAVIDIVLDELGEAGADLAVGTGLLLSADRTAPVAEAVELAHIAAAYAGRGVVAFGLANDEALWPPEPFAEAFAVVKDAGLLSVPHGGELAGPASVAGCLDACQADRVEHGVRAIEDPALVARLAAAGTCLDVCPSSNLALGVVPSLAAHPLPALLAAGVRCSLNGDDPLLFGPGIRREYELARAEMGLDDAALAGIARASLEASGAPRELVATSRAGVDAWLAAP
jgi:adenosine deaminase